MSILFMKTTIAGTPTSTGEQEYARGFAASGRRRRGNNEDRAVHLRRCACDHVLDIVGVAGAIDMRVVAGFWFHIRRARSEIAMPRARLSSGALSIWS